MISRVDAHRYLPAVMTACSLKAGWRSLLLRAYDDAPRVEPFTTPPTEDHLIVLVTKGACDVEGLYRGQWHKTRYGVGRIGMTAPGEQVTLSWSGATPHSTLQLHIPADTLRRCNEDLLGRDSSPPLLPHVLSTEDTLLQQVMLNAADQLRQGAPEIYAESAAQFVTMHLLLRHSGAELPKPPSRDVNRMRRVCDYMHAHLSEDISLHELAKVACLSRFHLVRMFKRVCGETPYQCLTRLRIERARQQLGATDDLIANVAFDCGFPNQAHFAATFRRLVGMSPKDYRKCVSG
jgi:AraC family transcriptional regulator